MTGAMKTTASDILEMHADVLPISSLLLGTCLKATARLATLPNSHPLNPFIKRASNLFVQHHKSPMHYLFHLSGIDPAETEKIYPYRRPPRYQIPFTTQITPKEDAITWDKAHAQDDVMIYSDGSGYKNQIGASAVLFSKGTMIDSLRYHLGPDTDHTVFEGELVGILLGQELAKGLHRSKPAICFNLDNQPGIKALTSQRSQPGQRIMDHIHAGFKTIQNDECETQEDDNPIRLGNVPPPSKTPVNIILNWSPGHEGIPGNEKADEEAKKAAEGQSSSRDSLPKFLQKPIRNSISAIRQRIKTHVKNRTFKEWTASPRYAKLAPIDRGPPANRFWKIIKNCTRSETSALIQLRTRHIPLNAHLHRIKQVDHPFCRFCPGTREDVPHLLLQCPQYINERVKLQRELGRRASDISYLLGTNDGVKQTMKYLRETGRFNSTFFHGRSNNRSAA